MTKFICKVQSATYLMVRHSEEKQQEEIQGQPIQTKKNQNKPETTFAEMGGQGRYRKRGKDSHGIYNNTTETYLQV